MTEKGEYDVLRLIEHNQVCYISSGCIRGTPLMGWLKYHRVMKKQEFVRMVRLLVRQLDKIHRCRKQKFYQYVNPYSVVVGEDGNLYFLDLGVPSNEETLQKMQRRTVREHFLPPEAPYYQRASAGLDIYGFGRTLQYLLSEAELEPRLTGGEERKFRKVISRCLERQSKQAFQTISEIPRCLPEPKEKKEWKWRPRKVLAAVAALVALAALAGLLRCCPGEPEAAAAAAKERKGEEQGTPKREAGGETGPLYLELGMLCLGELGDYERGEAYFGQAEGEPLAEELERLCQSLQGESVAEGSFRAGLRRIEEAAEKLPEEEALVYRRCVLLGYRQLDTKADQEAVVRLGKSCLEEGGEEEKAEVRGMIAAALEELGREEEALTMYEEQMEEEDGAKEREELYKKTASLLETLGKSREAAGRLEEGIREFPDSADLRITFLKDLLEASGQDRELCLQTIERFLKECPKLAGEEEFQKLMREYGINVEGGKVWAEKADP